MLRSHREGTVHVWEILHQESKHHPFNPIGSVNGVYCRGGSKEWLGGLHQDGRTLVVFAVYGFATGSIPVLREFERDTVEGESRGATSPIANVVLAM